MPRDVTDIPPEQAQCGRWTALWLRPVPQRLTGMRTRAISGPHPGFDPFPRPCRDGTWRSLSTARHCGWFRHYARLQPNGAANLPSMQVKRLSRDGSLRLGLRNTV